MLHEIFYWLFNMSLIASLSGLAVLLLRRIKGLPRRAAVLLWLVPYLRMVLPFGLSSRYSLMTFFTKLTTKTVVAYQPVEELPLSAMNFVLAANSYDPVTYKVDLLEDVFRTASFIWLMVFAALVITMVFLYVTTLRQLRHATLLQENVYLSEHITAPAVYGILRPRILLPKGYEERDLTFLLLHEKAHIRRGDNLWRVLALLVTALHWFNPFAWLFLKLLLSDIELVCDEAVLAKLGEEKKKAYATSLLDTAEQTNLFVSAFGGAKIRLRIETILSFKKMTRFSLIAAAILLAAVFYVLLTNVG